ncbi:unnamed protein product [Rotaria sp. Silwood1]|nr:unnamed protein product [Rotaria sp. Silwood1]
MSAFDALGKMGKKAATNEVIAGLLNALRDEDGRVRANVYGVISMMGEKAATNEVIAGLFDALRDEDDGVRENACLVLQNIGEKAATNEVIAGLANVLRDKNSNVRQYACEALKNMGEKAATTEVITCLVNMLADEKSDDDEYGTAVLEWALCSHCELKGLDSNVVSKLHSYIKRSTSITLARVPSEQLVKESRNLVFQLNVPALVEQPNNNDIIGRVSIEYTDAINGRQIHTPTIPFLLVHPAQLTPDSPLLVINYALDLQRNRAETSRVLKEAVNEPNYERARELLNAQLAKIRSSVSAQDPLCQQLIRDLEYQYTSQYELRTTMTNMYM